MRGRDTNSKGRAVSGPPEADCGGLIGQITCRGEGKERVEWPKIDPRETTHKCMHERAWRGQTTLTTVALSRVGTYPYLPCALTCDHA